MKIGEHADALRAGDRITVGFTHNIKIDGEDSWIKYEASTVKGDKETDQQVHDRIVGLVSTRVIEAAHVAVQTIENVKADAQ